MHLGLCVRGGRVGVWVRIRQGMCGWIHVGVRVVKCALCAVCRPVSRSVILDLATLCLWRCLLLAS